MEAHAGRDNPDSVPPLPPRGGAAVRAYLIKPRNAPVFDVIYNPAAIEKLKKTDGERPK